MEKLVATLWNKIDARLKVVQYWLSPKNYQSTVKIRYRCASEYRDENSATGKI